MVNGLNPEEERLKEKTEGVVPLWQKWGPYVSERQWGTVREDYSENGDSWSYFPHDMARSRAYRWGEDGIGGVCDRYQVLVLSFAFWNHKDPILKERLFGLNSTEGNHGEDVKELYYYLDNTPTHSYMKYLYKYPQNTFPYDDLVKKNKERGADQGEWELVDSGIFREKRYFDIFIEYAKISPEDLCFKIEIWNRGPEEAILDALPQLFFRNTWSWEGVEKKEPEIRKGESASNFVSLISTDKAAEPVPLLNFEYRLGTRYLYGDPGAELLFTNNDTNCELIQKTKSHSPYVKDAFHRHIISQENCVNPELKGTKAALWYKNLKIPAGKSHVIYLRLTSESLKDPLKEVQSWVTKRKEEADRFYDALSSGKVSKDLKEIQRQALSGMLWSKQAYNFHVNRWLEGDDPKNPPPIRRKHIRNVHWRHLISKRIMSMPDKWEYPWFAAWDLSFQTVPLALVDLNFAKEQLWLLLFDQFQHPNGQIPAYEWEFSDLNPPVQAWAVWKIYQMEYEKTGVKDRSFLQKCFHKMMINFVWWVNRVDSTGNNVFEGGFLGLDNVTVFDRSCEIPGGGKLEQSDGTGWMGLFCLMLMKIALELSEKDSDYESLAVKFFEHFVYIGAALEKSGNRKQQNWNEEDGFFYDVLCYPDGSHQQIFVRSLVGIIPLYAVDWIDDKDLERNKEFSYSFDWFLNNRPQLVESCVTRVDLGEKKGYLISLMKPERMKRILEKTWDPNEFRSEYGLRSLSKYHEKHPYELFNHKVFYEPGESREKIKGGNSNWRGPIWLPTNFLFVETLVRIYSILGDSLAIKIEGEEEVNLHQMAHYFAQALVKIFKEDKNKRAVFGDDPLFQDDPFFKDHLLFYEHFNGDNGKGIGASHQTGWTGLIANIIDELKIL